MSGQHSKDKAQIMLWLSKVQIAKLAKLQEKYGVSRTEIIDALVDRVTEAQLGFILARKQPDLPQTQTLKIAVNSPATPVLSQRQIKSAPKNQAK